MDDELEALAAIGGTTGWRIVRLLSRESLCGRGLAARLKTSESVISQQMHKLKDAKVIIPTGKGIRIFYSLNRDLMARAANLVMGVGENNGEYKKCLLLSEDLHRRSPRRAKSICNNCTGIPKASGQSTPTASRP
jgi:DNA-binding transcriptional ArsR family regulator